MDFTDGDILQISSRLDGVTLASAEVIADFAINLGDAGTLIDFGQGDSVLLHGVAFDGVTSDPGRFFTVV